MISEKIRKTKFGKSLKKRIGKSRSRQAEVNVGKIGKLTKKGDSVVVPGKVLGTGAIEHAVNVAAIRFSETAKRKIEAAGGKVMEISALENKKARVIV